MSGGLIIFLTGANAIMAACVHYGLYGGAAAWAASMVVVMADAVCCAIKQGQR